LTDHDDSIRKAVDNQLDYLFSDDDTADDGANGDAGAGPDPLHDLKAIFLAVDWEINDDIMDALIRQIDVLKETFKGDGILILFLQLLGAVGKYIKVHKANAHPDAVKLLNSIYTSLEIVAMSKGMTEAERKKILRVEVNRFKQLQANIEQKKSGKGRPGPEAGAERSKPTPVAQIPDAATRAALAYILQEMKDLIKSEFEALRAELER
jgi:hypothetical protein